MATHMAIVLTRRSCYSLVPLKNQAVKNLMITKTELQTWRTQAKKKENISHTLKKAYPLYDLEARFSFHALRMALDNPKLSSSGPSETTDIFEALFDGRWGRIQDSDLQYLHDFTNPANSAYHGLAKDLEKHLKKPCLAILMSSLSKVPTDAYISWSYASQDLKLESLLLSDDNLRLFDIADVLETAVGDGQLFHCSLKDRKPILLTNQERNRLISRHPLVKEASDAIQALVNVKFYGGTLGAALHRLSYRLLEGGEDRNGSSHIAGSDSNEAIAEFYEFLNTLNKATRKLLLNARVEDNFEQENRQNTVRKLWSKLSKPQTTVACQLTKISTVTGTSGKFFQKDTIILCRGKFYYYNFLTETRSKALVLHPLQKNTLLMMFSKMKIDVIKNCGKKELRLIKGILGRDPQGPQKTTFCVEMIAQQIDQALDNNPQLYEIDAYTGETGERLVAKKAAVSNALEAMKKGLEKTTQHKAYHQEGDDRLRMHLFEAIEEDRSFVLELEDIVYLAEYYARIKKTSNAMELQTYTRCKQILLRVFQEYQKSDAPKLDQSLEHMNLNARTAVIALTQWQDKPKKLFEQAPHFFNREGNKRKRERTEESYSQQTKTLRF